ncbi:MAG TPA: 50S ribosomal protein L25 [Egibacteraceae bacterium]|nr:50S ribosomal protein L25 [Egibacteraceae bacterium]
MSEQVTLAARKRAGNGKGEARSLRREGRVPAITYGTGIDPVPVSVDALELYHALHTDAGANVVLRLEVDGDMHLAFPREIHRHPVRRDVLHVDFVAIDRTKPVTADVPIVVEGAEDAPGASEGGVLEQQLHALSIEVLPLEVPGHLTADVSGMNVNDVLRVSDLAVPSGVTVLTDGEEVVVTCTVPALDVPETPSDEGEAAADVQAEAAEERAEDAAEAAGE